MSKRLSYDEKRYFTYQITRLKSEKERMQNEIECLETELDNVRDAYETLEQTNAALLEASELMSVWFDDDGFADSVPPRTRVFGIRRAIRKAKGE